MHRKLPSRLEPRASSIRALAPETSECREAARRPAYAAVFAAARSQALRTGLRALMVIAPLGALAGTVSACGAAAPVKSDPYHNYDPTRPRESSMVAPAPLGTIAPPATSSSAATPPHEAPAGDEAPRPVPM